MTQPKFKSANGSSIRKVIAVSACLLASGQLMAQAGFDFGLKGDVYGSTLVNLKDQAAGPELDFVTKVRVGGGISAAYDFNKHIGVELNVLYSKEGQDYKGIISQISPENKGIFSNNIMLLANANNINIGDPYTASVALTYIKIPILFKYTGNNTKKVYFSSFIGPQLDLLTSVKYKVNNTNASTSNLNMSSTAAYQKTGFDGVLGLGAGFNLPKHWVLSFHLRLDYGLTDAENKNATYSYGSTDGAKFYNSKRLTTNNGTAGLLVSVDYKICKKEKPKEKAEGADENGDDTDKHARTKKKDGDYESDADDKDDKDDKAQDKTKK